MIDKELDISAKIIGYGFGTRYSDMICTILPSEKGLKLGFYKGTELLDPERLLRGGGKVHKYVQIRSESDIYSATLKNLLREAYEAHQATTSNK